MKESELYLNFLKRNWFIFIVPLIISLAISIYLYAQIKPQVKISHSFNASYNLENLDQVLALMDQAVYQLRSQKFDSAFPDTQAAIYKSAPLSITIEVFSEDKELAYQLLLKETEYLRQNFLVTPLSSPQISQIEPSLLKYLISALIIGLLAGLIISLIKEYLQNF